MLFLSRLLLNRVARYIPARLFWNYMFLAAFAILRRLNISFVLCVCSPIRPSAWNSSAPTRQIVIKFDIWVFFENLLGKFKIHLSLTRIWGTLHDDQYAFPIIRRKFLLRMRSVSDKRLIFDKLFFENRAVYEIMLENIVQPDRPQMIIWRMSVVCWITKVTNTHSWNM